MCAKERQAGAVSPVASPAGLHVGPASRAMSSRWPHTRDGGHDHIAWGRPLMRGCGASRIGNSMKLLCALLAHPALSPQGARGHSPRAWAPPPQRAASGQTQGPARPGLSALAAPARAPAAPSAKTLADPPSPSAAWPVPELLRMKWPVLAPGRRPVGHAMNPSGARLLPVGELLRDASVTVAARTAGTDEALHLERAQPAALSQAVQKPSSDGTDRLPSAAIALPLAARAAAVLTGPQLPRRPRTTNATRPTVVLLARPVSRGLGMPKHREGTTLASGRPTLLKWVRVPAPCAGTAIITAQAEAQPLAQRGTRPSGTCCLLPKASTAKAAVCSAPERGRRSRGMSAFAGVAQCALLHAPNSSGAPLAGTAPACVRCFRRAPASPTRARHALRAFVFPAPAPDNCRRMLYGQCTQGNGCANFRPGARLCTRMYLLEYGCAACAKTKAQYAVGRYKLENPAANTSTPTVARRVYSARPTMRPHRATDRTRIQQRVNGQQRWARTCAQQPNMVCVRTHTHGQRGQLATCMHSALRNSVAWPCAAPQTQARMRIVHGAGRRECKSSVSGCGPCALGCARLPNVQPR